MAVSTNLLLQMIEVLRAQVAAIVENDAAATIVRTEDAFLTAVETAVADPSQTFSIELASNIDISEAVTVPANVLIQSVNGAMFVNDGGSISFEGVGLADPLSPLPIFSGFDAGDVTWDGDQWPRYVSTELFYTIADSVSSRLNILKSCFNDQPVVFYCHPRPITHAVILRDSQSLYFLPGVFENTWVRTTVPPAPEDPPFTVGSNCTISSAPGCTILGSNVDNQNSLLVVASNSSNTVVENNHFQGQGITFNGVQSNVLIMPGCNNCHIRNNWFDNFEGYNAVILNAGGDPPTDCTIDGNRFTNYPTQVAVITGGARCSIINNAFEYIGLGEIVAFAPIDVEPNGPDEILDDIIVENNTIYFEDTTVGSSFYAILAQGVNTRGFRRLKIKNNSITNVNSGTGGNVDVAIGVTGADNFEISGNKINHLYLYALQIDRCSRGRLFDNHAFDANGNVMLVKATAVSDFYYNTVEGNPGQNTMVEAEEFGPATSAGTVLTMTMSQASDGTYGAISRVYESFIGRTILYNNVEYVVDAITPSHTNETMEVTASAGTVANQQYVASASTVIVADNEIDFGVAHGWTTGCAVLYVISSGVVSGGLTDGTKYYIRSISAEVVKLYPTRADAIADTNVIDITSTGSGTHNLWPCFETQFSSNRYRSNDIPGGYTLVGDSVLLSEFNEPIPEP